MPEIGQRGIVFGGGLFQWSQLPGGQWGWKAPDGRQWDAIGNPYTQMAQQSNLTIAGTPTGGVDSATKLTVDQQRANDFLRNLPDPHRVNVASFNRLPSSVKEFTLAGFEAKGHDKGDVLEQFGRMLPKATGARRGYVAPLVGGG